MTSSKKTHGGVPVEHTNQLPRLRRIEGQTRGLQQMIAERRDCMDVINQISAVIAALRRVQGDMVREHIAACAEAVITQDLTAKERGSLAEEIGRQLKQLS